MTFTLNSIAGEPDFPFSTYYAKSVMANCLGVVDYVEATKVKGLRVLWDATGDSSYYYFVRNNVDINLNSIETYPGNQYLHHDIDYVNGASLVLFMYSQTGELKYQSAADSVLKYLKDFQRTADSGFYHKDWPRMQVDDLYMASPFLAEYGKLFSEQDDYRDAVIQATTMEKHTRDSVTGLYYHAWYEREYMGNDSGPTPYFWGRGVGWIAMALVDVLDFLPESPDRDSVVKVFQRLAEGISNFQDDSTGLWWQVLDKKDTIGNFPESSASCMFVYALAKGIRMGYIDESYWYVANKGFQGILDNFIIENEDSTITITNVCPGQSPGNTFDGYAQTPYEDGHAMGPFLMACVEIERSGMSPTALSAKTISHKQVNLTWKDNTDDEDGFRIERSDGDGFTEIAVVGPDTESYNDTTFTPLTAYIYRVRMYKVDMNSIYSNCASVITMASNGAPAYASQPSPEDSVTYPGIVPQLSWLPGAGTKSHDIYFGTTNPPPFVQNQIDSIFRPGVLEYNTTYYWQVNEVNDSGTTLSNTWHFTTEEAMILAAHFKLDENTGYILHDNSGNNVSGHWLTDENEGWITGVLGYALQFNGIYNYAYLISNSSFYFTNESFSISFWLKQSATDKKMGYLTNTVSSSSNNRIEVYYNHLDNKVVFEVADNMYSSMVAAPDTSFITGEWVHFVAVRNFIEDSLLLYANSKLVGYAYDSTGAISPFNYIDIGNFIYEENTHLEGALDDIRIYKYALDYADIKLLYNEAGIKKDIPSVGPELQLYPNPLTYGSDILYTITQKGRVRLSVYSITGQEVEVLENQIKPAGRYIHKMDVQNLNKGVYILKLQTDMGVKTIRMLYLK